jgi:hypothetical protein
MATIDISCRFEWQVKDYENDPDIQALSLKLCNVWENDKAKILILEFIETVDQGTIKNATKLWSKYDKIGFSNPKFDCYIDYYDKVGSVRNRVNYLQCVISSGPSYKVGNSGGDNHQSIIIVVFFSKKA